MLLLIPQLVDAPKTKKPEGKELKKTNKKRKSRPHAFQVSQLTAFAEVN